MNSVNLLCCEVVLKTRGVFMSKFDLISDALKGKATEERPLSLWQHFPEADRTPKGLAAKEIEFQKRFSSIDLKKICFHGLFPVVDYGIVIDQTDPVSGSTKTSTKVIQSIEDWESIESIDVNDGEHGKQIKAISLISNFTENSVPTMATVFTPLMIATQLTTPEIIRNHVRTDPDAVLSALKVLKRVVVEFSEACIDAGSDGIFLATQQAAEEFMTLEEYRKFEIPNAVDAINGFKRKTEFTVVHLHGHNPRFAEVTNNFPVDAINWHDQETPPTLAEANTIFKGGLLGGIDSNGIVRKGTPQEAARQVSMAIKNADSALSHLIVSPACVIPIDTPVENLDAIIRVVKGK